MKAEGRKQKAESREIESGELKIENEKQKAGRQKAKSWRQKGEIIESGKFLCLLPLHAPNFKRMTFSIKVALLNRGYAAALAGER